LLLVVLWLLPLLRFVLVRLLLLLLLLVVLWLLGETVLLLLPL
jgi:hypothetical protein